MNSHGLNSWSLYLFTESIYYGLSLFIYSHSEYLTITTLSMLHCTLLFVSLFSV